MAKIILAGSGLYHIAISVEKDVYTCDFDGAWLDGHLVLHRFHGWNGKGDAADGLASMAVASVLQGLKQKSISELSMGIIGHYGWQIANGAPVLKNLDEIGKIHCPLGALYLYERRKQAVDASTKTDCVLLRCGQAATRLGETCVRPANN